MATAPFLELPRELRDIIFDYATGEYEDNDQERRLWYLPFGIDRWDWRVHHQVQPPSAAYLSLALCNRQLNHEIKEYIHRSAKADNDASSKLRICMSYPDITPTWTHIPLPPEQTPNIDILVKIDHMYHPAYMTTGPHNSILFTVFEHLKRYITYGPYLDKPSRLCKDLHIRNVRITIAPPQPFADMTYVYGFPKQQLETLFYEFKLLIIRLSRSGIPYGAIDAFELRMEGGNRERFPVTSNVWDEEDFVFFKDGGFALL